MTSATPPDPAAPPAWKRALVWLERLVTVALLVFVAIRLGPQLGALVGFSPSSTPAPSFSLVTLDGDTIRSADLKGKVLVVNFWATWCIPCRVEMPSMQKLHERHAGDDLVVLGVSVDVGGVGPVRTFLRERHVTYPVGRVTEPLRRAFGGIAGIPTTFVIDRRGIVRHRVVGYFAPPALEASVSRLLADTTAAGSVAVVRRPTPSGGRASGP
jgi:peroxiredoxin